jgi:hypothetical protein
VVPLRLVDNIETISVKASKGKEFLVNITAAAKQTEGGHQAEAETRSVASEDTDDDNGAWSGKAARMHLRAPDAETRLLWVQLLAKAKQLMHISHLHTH